MRTIGILGLLMPAKIKGVVLQGEPIFLAAPYHVIVGYIESDANRDIPHYLIINTITNVIEGSSARLFEARGICQAYSMELKGQDEMISKEIDLVEKTEEADGNIDPKYQAKKVKDWKAH
jgi:hypothetical protein